MLDQLQPQQQTMEQPVLSSQELLNGLSQPSEAPVETPPAPVEGEVSEADFLAQASRFLGSEFSSLSDIQTRIQAFGQMPTLQQELEQLRAQVAAPKFYSPLSESVDKMLREGTDADTVKQFVELSLIDVDKLDPLDRIRRQYALEKPGYTSEEREALIERDLGFDPKQQDELGILQTATLKERSEAAATFLKSRQVSAGNPEAVAAAQAREAQAQQYSNVWKEVLPSLAPETKYKFQVDDQEFDLGYQPSSEALATARKAIEMSIQANPLAFAPTQDMARSIQDSLTKAVILADLPRFMNALFQHGFSEATKAAAQKYGSNGAPLQQELGRQQTVPGAQATGQQALFERLSRQL